MKTIKGIAAGTDSRNEPTMMEFVNHIAHRSPVTVSKLPAGLCAIEISFNGHKTELTAEKALQVAAEIQKIVLGKELTK